MSATRRLATTLAADVAGYSRLIGADEHGTLEHPDFPIRSVFSRSAPICLFAFFRGLTIPLGSD